MLRFNNIHKHPLVASQGVRQRVSHLIEFAQCLYNKVKQKFDKWVFSHLKNNNPGKTIYVYNEWVQDISSMLRCLLYEPKPHICKCSLCCHITALVIRCIRERIGLVRCSLALILFTYKYAMKKTPLYGQGKTINTAPHFHLRKYVKGFNYSSVSTISSIVSAYDPLFFVEFFIEIYLSWYNPFRSLYVKPNVSE